MKFDKNKPHFVIDYIGGGTRITHSSTGDTCLRNPWIHNKDYSKWTDKLSKFISDHPKTKDIINHKGKIINHVDDLPILNPTFNIGDKVVVLDHELGEYTTTITKKEKQPIQQEGDFEYIYILENGGTMFWNDSSDVWNMYLEDDNDHGNQCRIRRHKESEQTQSLEELKENNSTSKLNF